MQIFLRRITFNLFLILYTLDKSKVSKAVFSKHEGRKEGRYKIKTFDILGGWSEEMSEEESLEMLG